MASILFYTSGTKPFVENFFQEHLAQAERLKLSFVCITAQQWKSDDPVIRLQRKVRSSEQYGGLLEGILQGLEDLPDRELVFLAEDDCLYLDLRFDSANQRFAAHHHQDMVYQRNVAFISPLGFYRPRIDGICLHSGFGTAQALRQNITHKLAELNGESGFPFTSVEPVSWPSRENRDAANAHYLTRLVNSQHPLSIDFRGYGGQTWSPDGDEDVWQQDSIWGSAEILWDTMIGTGFTGGSD